MNTILTTEEQKELAELFPFDYAGGGYFRQKGIPVGTNAEILHGMQAIEYIYEQMKKGKSNENSIES